MDKNNPLKQRVFLAIPISENIKEEIRDWRKSLTGTWPVRWIAPENLHITLVPPWYEEEENLPEITKLLSTNYELQQIKPFEINLTTISFGPKKNSPRLIWASGETSFGVSNFLNAIYQILNTPAGSRPFTTHLTLARFEPGLFHRFKNTHLPQKISWQFEVNSFSLMESHLKPSGAEYQILKEVKFN